MSDQILPEEVRAVLAGSIRSVEQLEILLLLRVEGEAGLSIDELNRHLRSSPASVESRLKALCQAQLARCSDGRPGRYTYAPATKELDRAVTELAKYYLTHRVAVIDAMFSGRSQHLRDFAESFRLRGDGNAV